MGLAPLDHRGSCSAGPQWALLPWTTVSLVPLDNGSVLNKKAAEHARESSEKCFSVVSSRSLCEFQP